MARDMVRVPSGPPSMQYQAPSMRLGRSQFDLSHNHKTTFNVGHLVPYFLTEVVPGDTMTCKLNSFVRIFSPLDAPIMDNIEVSIEFFYVPNRLVWDHWEDFLGAHRDGAGAQDTDYVIPTLGGNYTVGVGGVSMHAYFGLPIGLNTNSVDVSALPFRAYRLIYNEWYRDQNLINPATVPTDDGPDPNSYLTLYKTAKKHDYFTSALPYLQKGDASGVPILGTAPVGVDTDSGTLVSVLREANQAPYTLAAASTQGQQIELGGSVSGLMADPLYASLEAGDIHITVNALREAAAIQRLLERDARGGTRHPELIRAHFGVDVPDYRTQRPEYLGGGKGFINVSPVAQTTSDGQALGTLAGIGTGQLRASWAKSFVEHGHVIGMLRARGEVSYQQGLDRMWSRQTRYDFLWPELAHLGEQAILNKELYVSNDPAVDDAVFGYQERFAEYRYKKSLVTGKLQSAAQNSLDFWHLAEEFGSVPLLNQTFVEDQTPMSRVTAVPSEPDFIIDGRFDLKVARALPVRPVPTLGPARF